MCLGKQQNHSDSVRQGPLTPPFQPRQQSSPQALSALAMHPQLLSFGHGLGSKMQGPERSEGMGTGTLPPPCDAAVPSLAIQPDPIGFVTNRAATIGDPSDVSAA